MSENILSNTVTFLFTDIEGSTQLWENYPEAMKTALARHDSLLRNLFQSHHGHIFKTVGDAFYVAFESSSEALIAAVDSQYALQEESWGEIVIKVRMALHYGEVDTRDNDYFGQPLNRVARLLSAGHGGQVLISTAIKDHLSENFPENISLRDMGEHRLKDLIRPEHIYQLVIPNLPTDFPPLKTLDISRTNLPLQLTSFVGREKELEQIKQRLEKNRLVTLTGSGGIGKTRLSIQVASELLDKYPNGVWLVELAPITDPALVLQTVCAALDVTPQGNTSPLNVLTDYLKPKKILLVVDNCEHLIDASAQLCEALLHACPNIRIIASSREALGIDGENAYRVPSLSLPNPNDGMQTIEKSEAVKLFIERATAALPEFEITKANASVVAQICQRLDGIALAIELAASRVKILKVEQIASRLDDAFRLLTGGSRTALPRQQTLRALIDWSYNLLSEEEQTILRSLSVFVGGWTLEAAEFVCENPNMLDLLTHFVDKSLIVVDHEHGDEPRYSLLETIRQYAREKLVESNKGEGIRELHANWFVELAERAEPKLRGLDQFHWLDQLEQDHDNFRAALEWSLKNNVKAGLRIGVSLVWFWDAHDHSIEGVQYMEKLLMAEPSASSALHANAFARSSYLAGLAYDVTSSPNYLGQMTAFAQSGLDLSRQLNFLEGEAFSQLCVALVCLFRGEIKQGLLLSERSLATFQKAGIQWGMYRSYTAIAFFLHAQRNYEKTSEAYKSALALSREAGDLNMTAFLLFSLGQIALEQEQYEQAQPLFQESLVMARQAKNKHMISGNLQALGSLSIYLNHFEQAKYLLEECVALQKDIGDRTIVYSLNRLGRATRLQDNYGQARKYYEEGLQLAVRYNAPLQIAWYLCGLAELAGLGNASKRAARLLGAAESIPDAYTGQERQDRLELEQIAATLRASDDEAAFQIEYEIGKQMNLDKAIAYALDDLEQI